MAKIGLSGGFRRLEEGPAQLLEIVDVKYDDKYNKATVTFQDGAGGTQTETYMMGTPGKKQSRGQKVAQDMFSTMAKHAVHDWTIDDIDPDELVGLTVVADVTKDKSVNEDTGEVRYYTHVRNFKEAPVEDGEADEEDDGEELFG